jgi:hypothetical protein
MSRCCELAVIPAKAGIQHCLCYWLQEIKISAGLPVLASTNNKRKQAMLRQVDMEMDMMMCIELNVALAARGVLVL